jgi:acyl-CoA reductase-like NAD-dependent aldehyde dehydrogenase
MHWTDGKWADSDEHRDSVNPATGEVIGSYAMGGPKEAQAAIEAAKRVRGSGLAYQLHDQFEEGGFKGSGVGRMRGFAVMDDFIGFKHIRLQPGTTPAV